MSESVWNTNIAELLGTFREGLRSLLPHLRRVRIPVGVHPGVDAWDDIAETLFKHIVVEAIRWSLPPDEMDGFELPAYEMDYESYRGFGAVIEVAVRGGATEGRRLVFHSFKAPSDEADSGALDTVLACRIREDWTRCEEHPAEIPFDRCEFRCLIKGADNKQESLTAIEVAL